MAELTIAECTPPEFTIPKSFEPYAKSSSASARRLRPPPAPPRVRGMPSPRRDFPLSVFHSVRGNRPVRSQSSTFGATVSRAKIAPFVQNLRSEFPNPTHTIVGPPKVPPSHATAEALG